MSDFILKNKGQLPSLGLGTWKSAPGEVGNAVYTAIKIGYRHIDCAYIYGNEKEIGQAISRAIDDALVKREELWITSKLWNEFHDPKDVKPALMETLNDLNLDYLDLYLMHWPVALKKGANRPFSAEDFISLKDLPLIDTWQAMEDLKDQALVKNLGVSNFNIQKLEEFKSKIKHPITVNQIEAHPYLQQPKMLKYCKENNIIITAYSPLGSIDRPSTFKKENEPNLLDDPVLKEIAKNHQASVAQIIIKWSIQRGTSVIPKSVNPSRMKENLESLLINLTEDEMTSISKLDKNRRFIDGKFWTIKGSPYTIRELWE